LRRDSKLRFRKTIFPASCVDSANSASSEYPEGGIDKSTYMAS